MAISAADRNEALRLSAEFQAEGAQPVQADILQPAGTLLDLYGENIRHRAYVTADPVRGEQMLRPDFTVPVVQMHMDKGAETARYTYMGEVFRKQTLSSHQASEYLQVGYEVFDRDAPAADAEVFALISRLVSPLNVRASTGDMGVLTAAVEGLTTTPARRAALMRHIWRPRRFRALLERFGGTSPVPAARQSLLKDLEGVSPGELIAQSGPITGLRSEAEILQRIEALQADAAADPIPPAEVEVLNDILKVREKAPFALEHLRDIAVDLPSLNPALERLARRLDALQGRGIDVDALDFEASYGRATLEYYDGFVFGFHATARPDLPPIASGGRYDALCRLLGRGREIPAVGGVIRPGLVVELREAAP